MNTKPVILFDGECILCNGFILFVIRNDRKGLFMFSPIQSPAAEKLAENHHFTSEKFNTIRLLWNNQLYERSEAVLKIFRNLRFPASLLYALILIPRFLRDPVYNLIAKNRYKWFGKKPTCMIPTPNIAERFITL